MIGRTVAIAACIACLGSCGSPPQRPEPVPEALRKALAAAGFLAPGDQDAAAGALGDPVRTALRAYQAHYGLEATGTADAATLELLSRPRCGVPDVGAGLNRENARWRRRRLSYDFENLTPDMDRDAVERALHGALDRWADASGIRFVRAESSNAFPPAEIMVRFASGDHGCGSVFDGAGTPDGNQIAHAFYPLGSNGALAGDLHFDEDETWSASDPAVGTLLGEFNLERAALHEIGHALGLDHSAVPGDAMYPYYPVPPELSANDRRRIRALYGP